MLNRPLDGLEKLARGNNDQPVDCSGSVRTDSQCELS